MPSASGVLSRARELALLADVAVTDGGALTLSDAAVGGHEYTVKSGPLTVSSFTESDWFSSTQDSVSSWLVVKGNLTVQGAVTIQPSVRKLFTVLYVTGDLVLNGNISMSARGANHGPAGSDIAATTLAVTPANLIGPGGTAGQGLVSDAAAGGGGGSGVSLTSSGGGGGGGSRYNASYGGNRSGHGAAGTAFSGGPGGGGSRVAPTEPLDAGERGGRGGSGGGDGFQSNRGGGGAGNPPYNDGGWANTGSPGTGGTLIIIVEGTISGTGTASANGAAGAGASGDSGGGGGSGGGVVYVASGAGAPTMQANGGSGGSGNGGGGSGGAGYAARIVIPNETPLTTAPTITSISTSSTLTWEALANATAYQVRADGGTPVSVGGLSYGFLLTPGEHTLEVRGVNASGTSPWASIDVDVETGWLTVLDETFDGVPTSRHWYRRGVSGESAADSELTATVNGGQGYFFDAADLLGSTDEEVEIELHITSASTALMFGPMITAGNGAGVNLSWYSGPNGLLFLNVQPDSYIYTSGYATAFSMTPPTSSAIRLRRSGNTFYGSYSTNGGATWSSEVSYGYTLDSKQMQIGFGSLLNAGQVTVSRFIVRVNRLATLPVGISYPTEVLNDGPVVFHLLQEAAGTTAVDVASSLPATYGNEPALAQVTPKAPASVGAAVALDGVDDFILLNSSNWFQPADSGFSMEGWFYFRSYSSWMRIFDFADAPSVNDMYFAINNGGGVSLMAGGVAVNDIPRFSLNVWHKILLTVSASGAVTIRRNGLPYYTGQVGAPTNAPRQYKYIGKSAYAADPNLNALVSGLAFYNKVLTADDDKTHYAGRDATPTGNLAIAARNATSTQARFVVQVDLAKLPDTFWSSVDSTLSDLRVRDGYGGELPFDLVAYDSTAKTGKLYFRTTVSNAFDQKFQIGGVDGATPPAATDPIGRNAVWVDYDCVYIFDGNEGVDRAGKLASLTLGTGITIANGRLNCAGAGFASVTGLPARTHWSQGVSFSKANTTQARVVGTGAGPRMIIDDGTTLGIYDGAWLYPSPNPALVNNTPYRAHQLWNGAVNRQVFREGGSLAGGTGSQATDATVVQASPTQIELGGETTTERLTGWINRFYSKPVVLTPEWIALEEKSWEDDLLLSYDAPLVAPTITATEMAVSSAVLRWSAAGQPAYQVRINGGPAIDVPAGQLYYDFTGLIPANTYTLEVRSSNPLGVSPWASSTDDTISALYYDNFNRINSTTSPGTPQAGGPYTARIGTWGINSNALYSAVSNGEAQLTFPAAVNFDITMKLSVMGTNFGFLWRWIDTNNTFLFTMTPTGIIPYRRFAGTWTQIHPSIPGTNVAGDILRVVAVGRVMQIFRNGKMIASLEDHWLASAGATCGFRFGADTTTRLTEALLVTGVLPTYDGETYAFDLTPTDPAHDSGFLYKGRDSKLADQGAVA